MRREKVDGGNLGEGNAKEADADSCPSSIDSRAGWFKDEASGSVQPSTTAPQTRQMCKPTWEEEQAEGSQKCPFQKPLDSRCVKKRKEAADSGAGTWKTRPEPSWKAFKSRLLEKVTPIVT